MHAAWPAGMPYTCYLYCPLPCCVLREGGGPSIISGLQTTMYYLPACQGIYFVVLMIITFAVAKNDNNGLQ